MKKMICLIALIILIISCTVQPENPLLQEWDTPFQSPPFDEIKNEHFMPAFLEGMKAQKAENEAIINNAEEPTFKNTLEALEKSGELFKRVNRVFNCLVRADTNDVLQQIQKEVAPLRTRHNNDINLNEKLFTRIKKLYETRESLGLTSEQNTV
ncbi:peptidase M3, partial [Candidatus Latescibacterota bacterium]